MWSSDSSDMMGAETLVREAAWLPRPTTGFRARVLVEASRTHRRCQTIERMQMVTVALLAATLLFCLPGYYAELRGAAVPVAAGYSPGYSANTSLSKARGWMLADDYEWGLVQAALMTRSQSARIVQGLL